MKLLFVCNSLEAGRDGVGDYVRVLASECVAKGHTCSLLALHDPYVTEAVESHESGGLPVLRLPANEAWATRFQRALKFREAQRPDWISIQFVPYGFHSKGIPWPLLKHLPKFTAGVPVHFMLHELWIGVAEGASLKDRLVGMIQRTVILKLLAKIGPRAISTSNEIYVEMLRQRGVKAQLLKLFGNIPVAPLPVKSMDESASASFWTAIFFGSLHPGWEPEPLFSVIQRAAASAAREVRFVAAGRLGAVGAKKWDDLAQAYSESFSFNSVGEQSPEVLSTLLQSADFGIAASPWQLIGKSGSALAMMEHGLPVIVNRDNWQARGITLAEEPEPLLHRCDEALEQKLIAGLRRGTPKNRVGEIADRFVCYLS